MPVRHTLIHSHRDKRCVLRGKKSIITFQNTYIRVSVVVMAAVVGCTARTINNEIVEV